MLFNKNNASSRSNSPSLTGNWLTKETTDWMIKKAEDAHSAPIPHITDAVAPHCPGTIHDYYSNGDYWWPNPDTANGLPYIRRDGETNPGNFNEHRRILRQMRTNSAILAAAYRLTEDERFAAQAIPGVCDGRGIGIIDTLHLIDVPFAVESLKSSVHMAPDIYEGLKNWFARYLGWMLTDPKGVAEMNEKNNHSVCFLSRQQCSPFLRIMKK